ncbi:(Fe-S)-binding protein, partial [bacterium]|nr:(Fe-S)-binding protein [candidate division CSSED10-310 bacterium]
PARGWNPGASDGGSGAMNPLRLLAAWLNLALHFNLHVISRFLGLFKPVPDGTRKFLANYREDRIRPLAVEEHERLAAISNCLACGACDAVCPVVTLRSNPSFPGPAALLACASRSFPEQVHALSAALGCLLCGRCEAACPGQVPITAAIRQIRGIAVRIDPTAAPERLQRVLAAAARGASIPPSISATGQDAGSWSAREAGSQTVIYRGCVIRRRLPHLAVAQQFLLSRLGIAAGFMDESCCGHMHREMGMAEAGGMARRVVDEVWSGGVRNLLVSCPAGFQDLSEAAAGTGLEVHLLLDYLARLKPSRISMDGVGVYPGCRLDRQNDGISWPDLLEAAGMEGWTALWPVGETPCCGAGGLVAVTMPGSAAVLGRSVLDQAARCGVSRLMVLCPACLYWLGTLRQEGHPLLADPVELMEGQHAD